MPRHVSDEQVAAIPGWFQRADMQLFRFFLDEQGQWHDEGDLAEIGVYLGASAALIGSARREGEVFTVVDLFAEGACDPANGAEVIGWYPDASRQQFEKNYRALHGELPVVLVGDSTLIRDHARHGTHRFVHVDASHLYDHVVEDITSAQALLKTDGVAVFDDYRSEHTPGVAAAVWQAVGTGMMPLAITPAKFYGTWDGGSAWAKRLSAWLPTSGLRTAVHEIAGHQVHQVWTATGASPAAAWVPPRLVPLGLRLRARLRRG